MALVFIKAKAQPLAFPGAEGFGCYTTGGRGGAVYEVTNLSDAGIGSLRYGIESLSGARTIIFRVSGIIELTKTLTIKNGNITIAGQTAPGDGICIKNKRLVVPASAVSAVTEISSYSFVIDADNVIVRYLRFRPGDEIDNTVGAPLANVKFENDAFWGRNHKNIIIDHCSMSWAIDEVASFYDNENFTMQWCILGESLYASFHPKGNHGYGGIWGGWGASFHHNLIADHTSRNPRFCGSRYHVPTASLEVVDFRNNVIFNWAGNSAYGGEGGRCNIVNNFYKPGPATVKKGGLQLYRIVNPSVSTDPKVDSVSRWYIRGNYMDGYPAISVNNIVLGQGFQPQYSDSIAGLWERVSNPFSFVPITDQTAIAAYDSVLKKAGASLFRDTIDKRLVYQTRTGVAATGGLMGAGTGIIDSPSQVGGWPVYRSVDAPLDSDHDGMPDSWEIAKSLNANIPDDRNILGGEGYTMLEIYLNEIASGIVQMPTRIEGDDDTKYSVLCLFSNPVMENVKFSLHMKQASQVHITLLNMEGSTIKAIHNGLLNAGFHEFLCETESIRAGMYILSFKVADNSPLYKKIVIMH
jgi:hypothetical protein